jgi:hypothetical protein
MPRSTQVSSLVPTCFQSGPVLGCGWIRIIPKECLRKDHVRTRRTNINSYKTESTHITLPDAHDK